MKRYLEDAFETLIISRAKLEATYVYPDIPFVVLGNVAIKLSKYSSKRYVR